MIRRTRGQLVVGSAVTLVLTLAGCSHHTGAAKVSASSSPTPAIDLKHLQAAHTAAQAAQVEHNLPAAALREPQPNNQRDRLLAESSELNDICTVIAQLGSMTNPDPDKLDAQLFWAEGYLNYLRGFDPRKSFKDRQAPDPSSPSTKPPAQIISIIASERGYLYAYWQRLGIGQTLQAGGQLDQPGALQAWLTSAYEDFVTSGFEQADSVLAQFQLDRCANFQPTNITAPQAGN